MGQYEHSEWRSQTEKIIALAGLGFSVFIFLVYFGFNRSVPEEGSVVLTRAAVVIFPLTCMVRFAYVRLKTPGRYFGWVSALLDVVLLTSIIYVFSKQYGTPAASLQAPSFAYYFVLIALHAMRFRFWSPAVVSAPGSSTKSCRRRSSRAEFRFRCCT